MPCFQRWARLISAPHTHTHLVIKTFLPIHRAEVTSPTMDFKSAAHLPRIRQASSPFPQPFR